MFKSTTSPKNSLFFKALSGSNAYIQQQNEVLFEVLTKRIEKVTTMINQFNDHKKNLQLKIQKCHQEIWKIKMSTLSAKDYEHDLVGYFGGFSGPSDNIAYLKMEMELAEDHFNRDVKRITEVKKELDLLEELMLNGHLSEDDYLFLKECKDYKFMCDSYSYGVEIIDSKWWTELEVFLSKAEGPPL